MTHVSDAIPASAQLVVVGAGPGGYHAAFKAAELGLAVTLIDPAINPGGVCLYRGCIPSKALLHVAKLVDEAHESAAIGVTFARPEIDIDRVRAWKDEVIGKLTGGLGQKATQKKLTYVRGTAEAEGRAHAGRDGARRHRRRDDVRAGDPGHRLAARSCCPA